MSWHVALLYNSKHGVQVGPDAPPDALAEYDSSVTLNGIADALRSKGHRVTPLEADETLLDTIRETRPDICFNISEGLRGDGREAHVPALLEMLGVPYTASKVLANALSLDKAMTKRVWRDAGLPTAPFQVFQHGDEPLDGRLAFPLFVKPVREGTGMGIGPQSIVRDEAALGEQVRWTIQTYRQPALAEGYLPGREFTVGVIGNTLMPGERRWNDLYDEHGFHVFSTLEIDTTHGAVKGIYNTEAKSYMLDEEDAPLYLCPADISAELEAELKRLAVAGFEAIGALDVSRVDFRLAADGKPYMLEINTLPGLNPIVSDLCIVSRTEGMAYADLINEILILAANRYGLR